MDDASGKASSSLAISEKRPQRPGGCVGILFQLFDWNRRLAKKKLFSKKLLPPDRAKRVSKGFSGDEKRPMAKLLLIADENRGGFPTERKCEVDVGRNSEMRPPGLIARLMGLESMPAVRKDKPKKPSLSHHSHYDSENKSASKFNGRTSELFGCAQDDLCPDEGHPKLETRPQKLQKTGLFDRRPETRFGAEALQLKTVLSRSKKHHQKLASPVRSPRRLSGKNAARLMGAAAKILEPGLQATNRAKCALTYSSVHATPKENVMVERTSTLSVDHSKHYACAAKYLNEQFPCKSCGNLLDVVSCKPNSDSTSEFSNGSQGSARTNPKSTTESLEQDRDVLHNQYHSVPTAQAKANVCPGRENTMEKESCFQEGAQHRFSNQQCRIQGGRSSSTTLQQRSQGENQIIKPKDRIPPTSKYTNVQSRRYTSAGDGVNGPKDFVALNRNLNSRTRLRMHPKVLENLKVESRRFAYDKQDDPLSQVRNPVRKRRPMNVSGEIETTRIRSASYEKPKTSAGTIMERKRVGLRACSVNQSLVKSELSDLDKVNTNIGNKDIGIVSFMFNSPVRHCASSSSPAEMVEKNRGQNDFMGYGTSQERWQSFGARDGDTSSQKAKQLKEDALGILLEQKLRELTCQDGDGLTITGKSTASILQELISALTVERPVSQDEDKILAGFDKKNSLSNINSGPSNRISACGQMSNSNRKFQAVAKAARVSVGSPLSEDGEHPSPGSVLEASFSNDSCLSDSLDGCSGCKTQPGPTDCFHDQSQTSGGDAELLDSAASFRSAGTEMVKNSVSSTSKIFDSIGLAIGLDGNKLNHSREVILNAELLFGNASPSDGKEKFILGPILLEELEILVDALSTSSDCRLGLIQAKERSQLNRFLLDCMLECLDLKYGYYCKTGFKTWKKMQLGMRRESLRREVYEEISKWANLAGRDLDEMIDGEVSHSVGKLMHVEVEAFETGAEIEEDILKLMINEMVIDLLPCTGSFFPSLINRDNYIDYV